MIAVKRKVQGETIMANLSVSSTYSSGLSNLTITGAAADIKDNLASLKGDVNRITSITPSDTQVTGLSVNDLLGKQDVVLKISGLFADKIGVGDDTTNISSDIRSNFTELSDLERLLHANGQDKSLDIHGTGTVILTSAEYQNQVDHDTSALISDLATSGISLSITGVSVGDVSTIDAASNVESISVTDTASNIANDANGANTIGLSSHVTSVNLSDAASFDQLSQIVAVNYPGSITIGSVNVNDSASNLDRSKNTVELSGLTFGNVTVNDNATVDQFINIKNSGYGSGSSLTASIADTAENIFINISDIQNAIGNIQTINTIDGADQSITLSRTDFAALNGKLDSHFKVTLSDAVTAASLAGVIANTQITHFTVADTGTALSDSTTRTALAGAISRIDSINSDGVDNAITLSSGQISTFGNKLNASFQITQSDAATTSTLASVIANTQITHFTVADAGTALSDSTTRTALAGAISRIDSINSDGVDNAITLSSGQISTFGNKLNASFQITQSDAVLASQIGTVLASNRQIAHLFVADSIEALKASANNTNLSNSALSGISISGGASVSVADALLLKDKTWHAKITGLTVGDTATNLLTKGTKTGPTNISSIITGLGSSLTSVAINGTGTNATTIADLLTIKTASAGKSVSVTTVSDKAANITANLASLVTNASSITNLVISDGTSAKKSTLTMSLAQYTALKNLLTAGLGNSAANYAYSLNNSPTQGLSILQANTVSSDAKVGSFTVTDSYANAIANNGGLVGLLNNIKVQGLSLTGVSVANLTAVTTALTSAGTTNAKKLTDLSVSGSVTEIISNLTALSAKGSPVTSVVVNGTATIAQLTQLSTLKLATGTSLSISDSYANYTAASTVKLLTGLAGKFGSISVTGATVANAYTLLSDTKVTNIDVSDTAANVLNNTQGSTNRATVSNQKVRSITATNASVSQYNDLESNNSFGSTNVAKVSGISISDTRIHLSANSYAVINNMKTDTLISGISLTG